MRSALLVLLGVSTQAAVIQKANNEDLKARHLVPRQLEGLLPGVVAGLLPTLQPATIDKIAPQFRSEAKREVLRYGPLTVIGTKGPQKGGSFLDPGGTDFFQVLGGLCRDCTVLSGATSVTFENKTTAMLTSGVYNHHIFVVDIGKSQKTDMKVSCGTTSGSPAGAAPAGQIPPGFGSGALPSMPNIPFAQLFGSGHDDTSVDFAIKNNSLNTGYYIPKGDTVFHFSTLVNYLPENQNVYVTIDYEYIPGQPKGYLDASVTALTATGCRGIMYMPPANQTSTMRGSPMTIQTPGYLFDVKAHLHDGGINVNLFVNNKLACTSEAIYGGADEAIDVHGKSWDTIQGYTKCSNPIRVEKGDEIFLEATYDTAAHPLRPGTMDMGMEGEAMGMASVVYARDPPSASSSCF